jgi:phosphonopyruvate decarboxylase
VSRRVNFMYVPLHTPPPGKKDEPQHMVQGKVMSALLADMGIPFDVLPDYIEGATDVVANAAHHIESRKSPFALLVKRQTFAPYKLQSVFPAPAEYDCNREQALKLVLGVSNPWDVFVSTTGFMSREVYEYRADRGEGHNRDFLCVGM